MPNFSIALLLVDGNGQSGVFALFRVMELCEFTLMMLRTFSTLDGVCAPFGVPL